MRALAVVLVLLGAFAAVADPPCASTWAMGKVAAAGTGVLLGSAALATAAGLSVSSVYFQAHGRPDPLVFSGGAALGLFTGVLLTQWLVPEVTRLANDALYRGEVSVARAEGWRRARWPALAAVMGTLGLGTGALLEKASFGQGQTWMLVGGVTVVVSVVVYAVVELLGALEGYQASRHLWERQAPR